LEYSRIISISKCAREDQHINSSVVFYSFYHLWRHNKYSSCHNGTLI